MIEPFIVSSSARGSVAAARTSRHRAEPPSQGGRRPTLVAPPGGTPGRMDKPGDFARHDGVVLTGDRRSSPGLTDVPTRALLTWPRSPATDPYPSLALACVTRERRRRSTTERRRRAAPDRVKEPADRNHAVPCPVLRPRAGRLTRPPPRSARRARDRSASSRPAAAREAASMRARASARWPAAWRPG